MRSRSDADHGGLKRDNIKGDYRSTSGYNGYAAQTWSNAPDSSLWVTFRVYRQMSIEIDSLAIDYFTGTSSPDTVANAANKLRVVGA